MKHFIIHVNYTAPLAKIDEILPTHRNFLQTGYDKGILLFSGPLNLSTGLPANLWLVNRQAGGIVAARAESIDELKTFFRNDPYMKNKIAEYSFFEFDPVKYQSILETWIK